MAYEWYKQLAKQGNIIAKRNLGQCFYLGKGTYQNSEEAFRLFKEAAENGDSIAQYLLGECYYSGYGTSVNEKESMRWFKASAQQGYEDAIKLVSILENSNCFTRPFRIGAYITKNGKKQR
jgi:TPR repeat protein